MKTNESFGPVIVKNGNKAKLNQLALAQTFVVETGIYWAIEEGTFLCRDDEDLICRPISIRGTKELLMSHIYDVAKADDVPIQTLNTTDGKLNSVLEMAKALNPARQAVEELFYPVANGVLHFSDRRVTLLPHNIKYGFRHSLPLKYDPRAKCPKFEEMLRRVLSDPADRRGLQMCLGGPLTGLNRTRRMLLMHGPSGTSKSTILNIQERILGPECVADLRAGLLESRFEKSHLLNKRQLSAKDVPANFLRSQGAKALKHLVGGDGTQAEVKFGGKVELHGNFFVVLASNGELRLALEGDEEAWMERLIVLEFAGTKPKRTIANYADVLLNEEAEGILNWLAQGAMMYLQEIGRHGDIRLNAAQKLRVENLVMASKSLEVFVSSKFAYLKGQDVTTDEVIRAYSTFCKQRGWEPVSSHVLYSRLPDLMLHKHGATKVSDANRDGSKLKGYRNVILLPR